MISKPKRFQIFLKRLRSAPAANSTEEAIDLVARTLDTVENEFSSVPHHPESWQTDGCMYPPQRDARIKFPERPSLQKYRNKGNYTYIGINGSIRIETLGAEILIDKPGHDGRKTHDLDP